jgi:hypothetical protein
VTPSRYYILDDAGEPLAVPDVLTWARWFETSDGQRILRRTQIGPYLVSTVFLALDHDYYDSGIPILWETMVFLGQTLRRDLDCRRYATREEAREGHQTTCDLVALQVEQEEGRAPVLVEVERR